MAYLQKHKATKDKLKHLEKSYMIKMAFQICGGKWINQQMGIWHHVTTGKNKFFKYLTTYSK